MLTCDTMDTAACVQQTLDLVAVGCQLVRITAPTIKDAFKKILTSDNLKKSQKKVFGYHGIVVGDRDLETVIRGFEIAAKENPHIELIIAGAGESLASLEAIVLQSEVKERIQLLGAYKQENLPALLDSFDYGIAPWKVNAFTQVTIANKFFEYALYGKPFIYASTNPMNRLIKEFQCGISYENANPHSVALAIQKLLLADKKAMIFNGRKAIIDKYNWSLDFSRLISLFKNNYL
jgi:glycosyltransferase involved in cell wall biosynthesis